MQGSCGGKENSDAPAVFCGAQTKEAAAQEPTELPPVADVRVREAIRSFYKNYACFHGRATKKEFLCAWFPFLYLHFGLITLVWIVFGVLMFFPSAETGWLSGFVGCLALLESLYWLGHFVPMLALGCRRLHDRGKSGWRLLWLLLGPFGMLYLLFESLKASDGDNKYGPRKTAAALAAEQAGE